MTNKLTQLFPQKGAYATAPVVNHAGAPAFTRSLEERTVQVLMTGNLESTFYCSAEDLAAEAVSILTQQANQDPVFLAKAIVYARNEGYLRVASMIGLVVLSKADPRLFKRIFKSVVLQPGDLQDFTTLVRSKNVRSTGKAVRKAVGDWMNSISDYHVVKYGAPQKKAGAGSPVNLRDVLRLTHPKPADEARAALFAYIVKRIKGDDVTELLPRLPAKVQAYEQFKTLTATPDLAKKNETKALELVEAHDLPYEVVTARLSTPAAWKVLARKAPFMNMLRNLNNYEKYGVFKDAAIKAQVVKRLTDPEQIANSKLFPFRFLAAYNVFQGDSDVRDALVKAVELSVSNIPELGRTLVAPDESGSMDSPVSDRSDITMKQVGNLFAAALWKKSKSGFMVPFTDVVYPVGYADDVARGAAAFKRQYGSHYNSHADNSVRAVSSVNRTDSLVTIAQNLGSVSGGTNLSAPLKWAMTKDFDTGVFITDSESWADLLACRNQYSQAGRGVLDEIRAYRAKHPKAQFFFIQIVQNTAVQAPQSEPGVHFIYGWSDQVLRYIAQVVKGGGGQVDAVKATQLPAYELPELHVAGGAKASKKTVRIGKDGKTPAQRRVVKASVKAKPRRKAK